MRRLAAMRRLIGASALGCALVLVAGASCQPGSGPPESTSVNPDVPPAVSVTGPVNGSSGVSTATEITFTAPGATTVAITLVDAGGAPVGGAIRADNASAWLPEAQLKYATKYTATVSATNAKGLTGQATATFTTMPAPPESDLVDVTSFLGDGIVYGVGMPITVTFGVEVPAARRAEVQRRLFVRSDPPQDGIWAWTDTDGDGNFGNEARYRPREFWKPGTKLTVRLATGGLAWGLDNWIGSHDLTLQFSIGEAVLINVDNATKKMTVTQNGQVLRTIPVSLGRPAFPSSSGNLLIMERRDKNHFTSASIDIPPGSPAGYSIDVMWTMQLTYRGEYIHAAPWSVAYQGKQNVSHGCINVSTANAQWLYNLVKVGTPVTVRGTEVHVIPGNGWTDWDVSWEEYVKGSALPFQPAIASSPSG